MISEKLDIQQFDVPIKEIYSSMGFRDVEPDDVSRSTTGTLLREAAAIIHPRFEYHILDGQCTGDSVILNGVTLDTGRIISHQLCKAERFAVFVATVGEGWPQWKEILHERDDVLQTFIADCIGSQIVESAADYMEQILQEELDADGLKHTNRFSPGYCGWQVSQQPLLFSLFPEPEPCGITLTESCLMMPEKSVSGIIGIGRNVRHLPYTCHICTMDHCLRRRR